MEPCEFVNLNNIILYITVASEMFQNDIRGCLLPR